MPGTFSVPSRSLAFKAPKNDLDKPVVLSFPSKSQGQFIGRQDSLIFRSDSNGEDLEGYAGAGLYESVTMDRAEERRLDYASDDWLTNERKRTDLLAKICR